MIVRRSRAFTLIELSVIVIILAVLAAVVTPRLQSYLQGARERGFSVRAMALIDTARSRAKRSQSPISLTYLESERRLVLREGDSESNLGAESLPESVTVTDSKLASGESPSGDWTSKFFSDGSCDGGSIQLNFGGATRTLILDKRSGGAKWSTEAASTEPDQWQAGELEVRGQGG